MPMNDSYTDLKVMCVRCEKGDENLQKKKVNFVAMGGGLVT